MSARVLRAGLALGTMLTLGVSAGWGQDAPVAPGQQGRLRADRVRYDARAKVLFAQGNVLFTLGAIELRADRLQFEQKTLLAVAEGAVTVREPGFSLEAQRVRYEVRRRQAQAVGDVVLVHGDVTVRAGTMRMDLAVQKISAGGGVSAQQGRGTVAGRTLQADLRARRAEVWGEAQLLRAPAPAGSPRRVRGPAPNGPQPPAAPPAEPGASEEISIKAGHLVLQWDPNAVAANGAVVVRQGPTVARAVRVAYTEASGRVDLSGAVTVEGFGEASAGGATLSADRVVVLLRERDIEASGSVTVHHQKQTAIANRGAYTGKTRRLVLTGRAQLQDEEGNVLRADAVTIDLEADTFEASGNVETIFKITRR